MYLTTTAIQRLLFWVRPEACVPEKACGQLYSRAPGPRTLGYELQVLAPWQAFPFFRSNGGPHYSVTVS